MRPLLGITMGDPAGVGPEISLKAAINEEISQQIRLVVFGSIPITEYYKELLDTKVKIRAINDPKDYKDGFINVIPAGDHLTLNSFSIGEISPLCGNAAYKYIESAVGFAKKGEISAIVTCPINKKALNLAGYSYSGHTEILANLTGTKNYAMMLASRNLRVVHVTTHVSLVKACEIIKKDRVYRTIEIAYDGVKSLGIAAPKIAVAGLNPHAGEDGLFGDEEGKEILPAVKAAQNTGINVQGPLPPDTVFYKASQGEYDVVIAMYHDQGHIPIKLLGFDTGVNITLGLPIIRTSVDHGTAFDIAGKGIASERSLIEAIRLATIISLNRQNKKA